MGSKLTALFTTQLYTGQFATLNFQPERGHVVTFWQLGIPLRYTPHSNIIEAVLEIVSGGMRWASEGERAIFDEDVVMAMEE